MRPRSAIGRPEPLSAGLGRVPASCRVAAAPSRTPSGIIIVIGRETGWDIGGPAFAKYRNPTRDEKNRTKVLHTRLTFRLN